MKFFTPWANASWFITEGMPVDRDGEPLEHDLISLAADWHLFGWCDLGNGPDQAELGYVMLSQLEEIQGPVGLKIERDMHFSGNLADVVPWMDAEPEEPLTEEELAFEEATV